MFKNELKKFGRDESGATAIEYAFIAVMLGLAIIAGAMGIRSELNAAFTNTTAQLAAANALN
jgi:pilus assembly protein Flp/PilA